jgi:hypothetical protein
MLVHGHYSLDNQYGKTQVDIGASIRGRIKDSFPNIQWYWTDVDMGIEPAVATALSKILAPLPRFARRGRGRKATAAGPEAATFALWPVFLTRCPFD